MKGMGKSLVVFSGYNQRAVIAFLRTLQSTSVKFGIIAKSKDDPIFRTEYARFVTAIREQIALDIDDITQKIRDTQAALGADPIIIAPSTEALNRFFLERSDYFYELGCLFPVADKSVYETISDKEKFATACKEAGILVPGQIGGDPTVYPVVAKPKQYTSSGGLNHSPFIINSKEEYDIFLAKQDISDFFVQQFVTGRSIYLLYYINRNGQINKYSQENLIQQPGGKSILAAISSNFHSSKESERYELLFKTLGFRGFVMVEVKVNGEQCYMIEANPRFWGPSQFFVDSNVNFFTDFLEDYGLLSSSPKSVGNRESKYFWFGGVRDVWSAGQELIFHNYNMESFLMDLPGWLEVDIYKRKDTIRVFKEELCKKK